MDKLERQAREVVDTQKKEVKDQSAATSKKNCKPNKRNRSNTKPKDFKAAGFKGKRLNDPAFYNSYYEYSQEAGKLAFGVPLGAVLHDDEAGADNFAVPGVMSFAFVPTVGVSTDFTSPMNRSSIHYWTQLRSIQKASAPYDHQDVTMMMLAMDSCYIFHELMRKAYGIMRNFTPLNRYYPRAVIAALGFNFNDLLSNLDDFRAYINQFAYNCGQYALPNDIWLFARHQQLTRCLLVDSETTRAQSYNFVPAGLWQYDNTVTTGSQLKFVSWLGENPQQPVIHTFAETVAFGNALINAISNEQDFSYISGDMLQLYGPNNVHKLDYTPELYTVYPEFSDEMRSQVENMVLVGEWANNYSPVISQNPSVNNGAIIFDPKFVAKEGIEELWNAGVANFINMHIDHPSSDDVLVATRLMPDVRPDENTTGVLDIVSCGTELVQYANLWEVNTQTGAFREIYLDTSTIVSDFGTETTASIIGDLQKACRITQFDWHPLIRWYSKAASSDPYAFTGWLGDIDNFARVPAGNLFRMHEASLFSLFDVRSATQSSNVKL